MDIGPIIGLVTAFALILIGGALEGVHLSSLVSPTAGMIVVGGSIGAAVVQYPLSVVKASLGAFGQIFKKSSADPHKLIDEIVDYANKARRDGILGLERIAPNASDPFLAKALMMAIDGADSGTIRDTMDVIIMEEEEHKENAGKFYEAIGGYSPTIGIIGAVLGLIHVMGNLSDINAVGSGIAGAFVATIYGLLIANVICLPLGGRIKMRAKDDSKLKEMMLVGVLAIQEGTNPKLVRDRLAGFVPAHGDAAGAAQPAGAAA